MAFLDNKIKCVAARQEKAKKTSFGLQFFTYPSSEPHSLEKKVGLFKITPK